MLFYIADNKYRVLLYLYIIPIEFVYIKVRWYLSTKSMELTHKAFEVFSHGYCNSTKSWQSATIAAFSRRSRG